MLNVYMLASTLLSLKFVYVYLCVCVYVWMYVPWLECGGLKTTCRSRSLLPLSGSQALNSRYEAGQQMPLSAEPPPWPYVLNNTLWQPFTHIGYHKGGV